MIGNYRAGIIPQPGELEQVDRNLLARISSLPSELAASYERCELQQCALLPLELARATNVYIDSTAPFKLAKDPEKAGRLDTVLYTCAQAVYCALAAFLPILTHKAADGLAQLGVSVEGRALPELLAQPLSPGHRIGEGRPLFPRIETT
jgi:methionyl-tRNA synthetase